MRWLIDSGLLMRAAMVVANIWLIGGLAEVFKYAGDLVGRVNILSFAVFGVVLILGSALVIQKSVEHLENRLLG